MSKLTHRDVTDIAPGLQHLSSVRFQNATLRYRVRHNLRKLGPIAEDTGNELQAIAEKHAKRNADNEIIRTDNGIRIADMAAHRAEVKTFLSQEVIDASELLSFRREWLEAENGTAERQTQQSDGTTKMEKFFFTADLDAALGDLIEGEPAEATTLAIVSDA